MASQHPPQVVVPLHEIQTVDNMEQKICLDKILSKHSTQERDSRTVHDAENNPDTAPLAVGNALIFDDCSCSQYRHGRILLVVCSVVRLKILRTDPGPREQSAS